MIPEDEGQPLPPERPDEKLDTTLRAVVSLIIIVGGGFLALEFFHWLANGGLRPFLTGAAFTAVFFFILILWSKLLAEGGRALRRKPSIYSLLGLLTAGGILVQHFMVG